MRQLRALVASGHRASLWVHGDEGVRRVAGQVCEATGNCQGQRREADSHAVLTAGALRGTAPPSCPPVSSMRLATTRPETKLNPATTITAARRSNTSATTPPRRAPTT